VYTYNEAGIYTVSLTVTDGTNTDIETKLNYINVELTNASSDVIEVNSKLIGNYPNPFNPETTIKYNLSKPSYVEINIYNIKGQLINSMVNSDQYAGIHTIIWNGKNNSNDEVSSGLYLFKLVTDNKTIDINKCLLLK